MQLYRHLTANHITLKDMPFLRELSMEAYLVENPEILALDTDELSSVEIIEAEVPMPHGRPSKHGDGRIDLIAAYGESTLGIVELKLGELSLAHLKQLEDYLSETEYLKTFIKERIGRDDSQFVGILVGTSIANDLRTLMEKGHTLGDSIPIAALTLSRFRGSDNNMYVATEIYFKNLSRKYDRTKYRFDGQLLNKNRLVLAVIRRYVEANPESTYAGLQKVFPQELQGSYGCFDTAEKAQEVWSLKGYKRHFIDSNELIELSDSKIAVCSQWAISNIRQFVQTAQELKFKIDEVKG